ncbi:MAG: hypothetical protein QNJ35_01975 [Paracoccaceae bacterium]|nr:hypothetical protein [Paracoccaceae bacterium]
METSAIIFDPLLPWGSLWAGVMLAALFVGVALWRGLRGWWLRGLAFAVLLLAISNPSLQVEEREALSDIVILVVDESASQRIAGRPDQTAEALAEIEDAIAGLSNTELRIVRLADSDGNRGTLLMDALSAAMAEEPRSRIAGAILLTDGQLHDLEAAPEMPAPLHALLTGREDDWDRRLIVQNAPAFAIIGEPVTMTLRIEDQGDVPSGLPERAAIDIAVDGEEAQRFEVPIGEDLKLPVTLQHGGINVIQFALPEQPGELTTRNNAAVVQINGVRDRLRVLLVSGEPHAGERTWRNLLKSDASVDLVHFTILRPPEKQDGVPVNELSLIAFPTRELFLDKVDEFDLIIFDRYKRRGILPSIYLDNVRRYVEDGGALLIAAGPDYASADSIYRSPLSTILPAAPSGRVLEEPFAPMVTEIGQRHPVTEGFMPLTEEGDPPWGRWLRLVDVFADRGTAVMSGVEDRPLLVLDRVGTGRVALLTSDHAWLWSRGFEGGGPQLELLRRLAHWMMKEPDLEEEALTATAEGQTMTITRRTLGESVGDVEITGPDGAVAIVPLEEVSPGRFSVTWEAPDIGLYRLAEGDQSSVIALGPASPKEFEETISSGEKLADQVAATRGGIRRIDEGVPDLRHVREGRAAAGRGWLGITPRDAYVTADIRVSPLLPAWALLLLASLLAVAAWLREGRR